MRKYSYSICSRAISYQQCFCAPDLHRTADPQLQRKLLASQFSVSLSQLKDVKIAIQSVK